MNKLTRIFRGGQVRPITPEKAQELIDAGASPAHPAFSRTVRDNIVQVDFKSKKKK
jgi:hypothetical protein